MEEWCTDPEMGWDAERAIRSQEGHALCGGLVGPLQRHDVCSRHRYPMT